MLIACVDVGSTFTKAALVDVSRGSLLATSDVATTLTTDVMVGVEQTLADLATSSGRTPTDVRICSSAGGGLRLAVVGYEAAVSAEAGRRVALSAGGHVVHVAAGVLHDDGLDDLLATTPDVVLLVGGTDGGNAEVLLSNAEVLSRMRLTLPVVVAGNAEARDEVHTMLGRGGVLVQTVDNVLPEIGVLNPRPAREAIRAMFLAHVIGGKQLSGSREFAAAVRAATPDAVLVGVELLSDGAGSSPGVGDVLVIDVGGATTDVYSVVTPDPEDETLRREVVEPLWRQRTVEGDLGMRSSAPGVVSAAADERLLDGSDAAALAQAAARRHREPGMVPADEAEAEIDRGLAGIAATVAVRRHARPALEGLVRSSGVDLSRVAFVVGSGGVLRHANDDNGQALLARVLGDTAGGWKLPEQVNVCVDRSYVLAAAGLLADDHAEAAARLLQTNIR